MGLPQLILISYHLIAPCPYSLNTNGRSGSGTDHHYIVQPVEFTGSPCNPPRSPLPSPLLFLSLVCARSCAKSSPNNVRLSGGRRLGRGDLHSGSGGGRRAQTCLKLQRPGGQAGRLAERELLALSEETRGYCPHTHLEKNWDIKNSLKENMH